MNALSLEQIARKEAEKKAAESAKARIVEETLNLEFKVEGIKGQSESKSGRQGQGRRGMRYLPDGSVQIEGPGIPDDPSSPPIKSIDFKA